MSDTSIFSQATAGGNDPNGSPSTLVGFHDIPSPFFQAMNQQSVTNLSSLAAGNVGTFLQNKKLVNGNIATIINASSRYIFGDKTKNVPPINPTFNNNSVSRNFIPIILKTDFLFNMSTNVNVSAVKTPMYIIFDSTPDNITMSKAANWVSKEFLGRPEPVFTYNNSGPTTFQLVGKFFTNSFESHGRLLKVSDYIMALVTPSEMNYMPSPITVFIGEWQALHCIVTSVSIKYSGPWSVPITMADVTNSSNTQAQTVVYANALERQGSSATNLDTAINVSAQGNSTTNGNAAPVPSHAPYIFEATFSFTVVGQDNKVNYAEQVISTGINNSSEKLFAGTSVPPGLEDAYTSLNLTSSKTVNNGSLYSMSGTTQYTFENGQITQTTSDTLKYSTAAQNMNLYDSSNSIARATDQGLISSAVNNQMLSLFQKANPNSTNTPGTSSSLNPFRKLF